MRRNRKCPLCDIPGNEAPTGRGYICPECGLAYLGLHSSPTTERTTRDRSSRQEEHNARLVGGHVTANSGAGRDKGDVKVPGLLREEDKTTLKVSYVLRLDTLRKIASAARGDEIPVLRISFEDRLDQQYVVLPSDWFQQLLDCYKESM